MTEKRLTPIEELFSRKIFSYDVLVLQTPSILDYKFDYFLSLFFEMSKKISNQTKLYVSEANYNFINERANTEYDDKGLFKKALDVLDKYNQIECLVDSGGEGNLSSTTIIKSFLMSGKRVLVVTESSKDFYDIRDYINNPELTSDSKKFKILKLHNFISNEILSVSDYFASSYRKADKPIVYDYSSIKEGATLYRADTHQPVRLIKSIGAGGEASCFIDDNNYVCKIFNEKSNTTLKKEKISYMISLKKFYTSNNIAWPQGMLEDSRGNFVGFYMNRVENAVEILRLGNDVDDRNAYIKNKKNIVKLCLKLCSIFTSLHEKYVILGDINYCNILFNQDNYNVYLIDLDSAQIDRYYCKVKFEDFLAPEQITDDFRKGNFSYRTEQSELFILARLLFQLLIGDDPYSCNGTSSQNLLMWYKIGVFPYPLKRNIEGGDYSKFEKRSFSKYAWDSLPYFVRNEFFQIFSREYGRNYFPGNRPTSFVWARVLEKYLKYLEELPPHSNGLILHPMKYESVGDSPADLEIKRISAPFQGAPQLMPKSESKPTPSRPIEPVKPPKNDQPAPKAKKEKQPENLKNTINGGQTSQSSSNKADENFAITVEKRRRNELKTIRRIRDRYVRDYSSILTKSQIDKGLHQFNYYMKAVEAAKKSSEIDKIHNEMLNYRSSLTAGVKKTDTKKQKDEKIANSNKKATPKAEPKSKEPLKKNGKYPSFNHDEKLINKVNKAAIKILNNKKQIFKEALDYSDIPEAIGKKMIKSVTFYTDSISSNKTSVISIVKEFLKAYEDLIVDGEKYSKRYNCSDIGLLRYVDDDFDVFFTAFNDLDGKINNESKLQTLCDEFEDVSYYIYEYKVKKIANILCDYIMRIVKVVINEG